MSNSPTPHFAASFPGDQKYDNNQDGRSNDIIVTFIYQGKHEFIKVHRPEIA